MGLLFILIFLLYQISCDKIEDGILAEKRFLRQLWKNCLENEGNVRIFESSKSRIE